METNKIDVKEILCQQLQLLAEHSKKMYDASELANLSRAMVEVAQTITNF